LDRPLDADNQLIELLTKELDATAILPRRRAA
jgi:hypothetical protein